MGKTKITKKIVMHLHPNGKHRKHYIIKKDLKIKLELVIHNDM